ncbi:MAG: DUF4129 domain-containing protein [Aureliella sp.]
MRLLFLALACSFLAVGEYRIASAQDAGAHRDRPSQRWLPQPDGAGGNVLDQLRVLEQLRRQMAADSNPSSMPELTEDQLQVLDQAYQTWVEQSGGAQLPDWDSIPKEWVDQALANPEQLRAAQRLIQQYVRQRKIPNIPLPSSLPSLPKDWQLPWQGEPKGSKANDSTQPDSEAKRSDSSSGEAEGSESPGSLQQGSAPRDAASSQRAGSRLRDAKNAARLKPAQPDREVSRGDLHDSDAADSDAADSDAADREANESDRFRSDGTGAGDDVSGQSSLGGADAPRNAKARAASGKTNSAGSGSSSTRPSATDEADNAADPFQADSSRHAPGASAAKGPPSQSDAAQLKALRELLEKAVQAAGPSAGSARGNAPARRPEPNRQAGARGSAAQPMPRAPGALYPRQSMTPIPSPTGQGIPPSDPRSDAAPGANDLASDQPESTGLDAGVSADSGLFYAPSPLPSNAAASNSSARANGNAQHPAGPRGAAAGASAQHAASSSAATDFGAGNWDLDQLGAEASAKLRADNSQAALQEKIKRDVQQLGWNGALHRIIQETFQEELKASQSQQATKPDPSASNSQAHETKRGGSHMLNIDTSAVRKHLPNFFSDGRVASALAEVWKAIANAPLTHSDSMASALPSGASTKHHSHKSKSGSQLGLGGNEVRIALVMIAAVALAVWVGRKRPAWFGVEQPIDPRWAKEVLAEGIRTRADVIRAFHRLVAQTTEPVASWWTHRYVARRLAEATPQLATAMADLSSVYEQARYMPPEAELSSEQISRVCRALRECVAYGNSNSAADATP